MGLAPGRHDVGVIVGDDDDVVDALGLECGLVLDVSRQVRGLADGREGTGEGDENDLFVTKLCAQENMKSVSGGRGKRKGAGG